MQITRIAKQESRDRYNIFVDGKFFAALSSEVLAGAGIAEGDQLQTGQLEPFIAKDEEGKVLAKAYDYLSRRPHSIGELHLKLERKEYPAEHITAVIKQLEENGYLDDVAFAKQWVAERGRNRGYRLLQAELRKKQVSDEATEEALATQRSDEIAGATELAAKRLERLDRSSDQVRAKLIAYLIRRGYDYGTAKEAVSQAFGTEAIAK
jgi:regulatory protein